MAESCGGSILSAQTPMKKMIREGTKIYTEDMAGNKTLVSESPNLDQAQWLLSSLKAFHVNTEVEETDAES